MFTPEQILTLSKTIAPGLTDDEMSVFLHVCDRSQLDPFVRQIYAIKRGDKLTVQTAIDGLRLIADRTGKYSPGRDTEFLYDDKHMLIGAKVFVKKLTPDRTWHEVSATALLAEFSTGRNLWATKPHVMIEKVAESRCLRRCFPDDISGLYSDEEMDRADADLIEITPEPVIESKPDPAKEEVGDEQWDAFNDYLDGKKELRKELQDMCKTTTLRNISMTQLETCKAFIKAKEARNQNTEREDDK